MSPGVILAFGMGATGVTPGLSHAQARFTQSQSGASVGRGRAEIAPSIARYVAMDDRAFVLDRSTRTPLLKFEGSQEVWILRPAPGPRGDVIYKDDLGRQMVRASRMGGVTVFTADRPSGLPAALTGQAVSIRPSAVSPEALLGHFVRQAVRVSRAVGRRVPFEAPEVTAETSTLFADAATTTAEALVRYSGQRQGGLAARLRRVRFVAGAQPNVAVSGGTLNVTVAPNQGFAGRPSSERIVRTMAAAD